jgi:argininosuccinate lyase
MHLSRLSEEMVIWSSSEYAFVELDDAYTTGSSIMPQKKNPDVAELCRGKTGRVYGSLNTILTVMKGLPLSYNRDLQEDKEPLFDCVDTLGDSLEVFAGMIKTAKFKPERMLRALEKGYVLATDIADYLVGKGESFRNSHGIVARLVSYAVAQNKTFGELSLAEYRQFSNLFEKDIYAVDIKSALNARNLPGGTAPKQIAQAIARAKKILAEAGVKN